MSEPHQQTDSQALPAHTDGQGHAEEYERTPVPRHALLGFKSFVGMYAGEHCAGTEIMLGPLFVAAGVSAFDLIVGLIVGNALAVLSWMLMCAPIATRVRLTLYCQLEKICGRNLVTLYNLTNGVMFTILAGAMITVSANRMRAIAKYIALVALVLLIAPPLLFLAGTITDLSTIKTLMLAATLLWFAAATIWMWPEKNNTHS